jgi:hypothetical protein
MTCTRGECSGRGPPSCPASTGCWPAGGVVGPASSKCVVHASGERHALGGLYHICLRKPCSIGQMQEEYALPDLLFTGKGDSVYLKYTG